MPLSASLGKYKNVYYVWVKPSAAEVTDSQQLNKEPRQKKNTAIY